MVATTRSGVASTKRKPISRTQPVGALLIIARKSAIAAQPILEVAVGAIPGDDPVGVALQVANRDVDLGEGDPDRPRRVGRRHQKLRVGSCAVPAWPVSSVAPA